MGVPANGVPANMDTFSVASAAHILRYVREYMLTSDVQTMSDCDIVALRMCRVDDR